MAIRRLHGGQSNKTYTSKNQRNDQHASIRKITHIESSPMRTEQSERRYPSSVRIHDVIRTSTTTICMIAPCTDGSYKACPATMEGLDLPTELGIDGHAVFERIFRRA